MTFDEKNAELRNKLFTPQEQDAIIRAKDYVREYAISKECVIAFFTKYFGSRHRYLYAKLRQN